MPDDASPDIDVDAKPEPVLPVALDVIFVIDSREQRPYSLQPAVVRALPEGDYTIQGHETEVVVERKSLPDMLSSLTSGRSRFLRECERLSAYDYPAIVCEGDYWNYVTSPQSRMHWNSRIGSIVAISQRYGVFVWFVPNRREGERLTARILTRWATDVQQGKKTVRLAREIA